MRMLRSFGLSDAEIALLTSESISVHLKEIIELW